MGAAGSDVIVCVCRESTLTWVSLLATIILSLVAIAVTVCLSLKAGRTLRAIRGEVLGTGTRVKKIQEAVTLTVSKKEVKLTTPDEETLGRVMTKIKEVSGAASSVRAYMVLEVLMQDHSLNEALNALFELGRRRVVRLPSYVREPVDIGPTTNIEIV